MDSRHEFKDDGRHDFQAESFVQLGDYLSSLERRATASTQTSANEEKVKPQSTNSQKTRALWRTVTVTWALVVIVVVLLGTNAYTLKARSSLEAENSSLKARVAELNLERDRQDEKQAPRGSTAVREGSCPTDIMDTCFFKMGLGPCAKKAFKDPIGRVEHALSFTWNSTAELVEAIGTTIAEDFRHLGREIHSAGTAALNFLGISTCHGE